MDVPSPSPTASTYDYVYDKDSDSYVLERSQDALITKLHWVVVANLVLLLIFCFITILTSGLVFGGNVESNDCLGQSWVMFSVCHISPTPSCTASERDNKRLQSCGLHAA